MNSRIFRVNFLLLTLSSLYASAPSIGAKIQPRDVIVVCYGDCQGGRGYVSSKFWRTNIDWIQADNVWSLVDKQSSKQQPLDIILRSGTSQSNGVSGVSLTLENSNSQFAIRGYSPTGIYSGTYIRSSGHAFRSNIFIDPESGPSKARGSALLLDGNHNGYALYGNITTTLDKNTTLKVVAEYSIKGDLIFTDRRSGEVAANTSYEALDGLKNRAYSTVTLKDKANVWFDFANNASIDGNIIFKANMTNSNNNRITSYQDKQIFNFGSTDASINDIKGKVTSDFGNLVLNFKGEAWLFQEVSFSSAATLNLNAKNVIFKEAVKALEALLSLNISLI